MVVAGFQMRRVGEMPMRATHDRHNLLDCAKPAAGAFWFGLGTILALVVMSAYGLRTPGSLLHAGSNNPLLHEMEQDLGPLTTGDPTGHDGQLYYLIARDPLARGKTPAALAAFDNNGPQYRYRRILFPLLAGAFGRASGRATLYAMIAWLAIAMGLASVAVADIGFQLGVQGEVPLLAVVNAGALASLLFLTPDTLALALTLAGIALTLRSRTTPAVALFAMAALAKEVYVLVPAALAVWSWRSRGERLTALKLAIAPCLPIALWSVWVYLTVVPDVATAAGNLGAPFVGVVQAMPYWLTQEPNRVEQWLAGFMAVTILLSLLALAIGRNGALRAVVAAWLALACFATVQVWGKPNNAARVFVILWPLSVLLVGQRLIEQKVRPSPSTP